MVDAALPPRNSPPDIVAVASPASGIAPLAVILTAQADDVDGQIISLDWSLGDGTQAHGERVRHVYPASGRFTARVTATDDAGATSSASVTISVGRRALRSSLRWPTRIAVGPDGRYYVTDGQAGSLFILDSALQVQDEHSGFERPLGVAVGRDGRIYVGSAGRHRVEVLDSGGQPISMVGEGVLQMPNDLALDADRNLYVADSTADSVRIFNPEGALIASLPEQADPEARFPISVTIAYRADDNGGVVGELYVAYQISGRIHVYDLDRRVRVRALGGRVPMGSSHWEGRFSRLQSLDVDRHGHLHAVDAFMSQIQVLDAMTGAFRRVYGTLGVGPTELNVPLDLVITAHGQVIVTNSGNRRVELIDVMQ